MVWDLSGLVIKHADFGQEDWDHSVCEIGKELTPDNTPMLRGYYFIMYTLVISDHQVSP